MVIKKSKLEDIRNSIVKLCAKTAKEVAEYVYNSLPDDYLQDNDWSFKDYYATIKSFGSMWELRSIDPSILKFNEEFDIDRVEYYEYELESGKNVPAIVVDKNYEIIDGNHRAKACLNLSKNITAWIPF